MAVLFEPSIETEGGYAEAGGNINYRMAAHGDLLDCFWLRFFSVTLVAFYELLKSSLKLRNA